MSVASRDPEALRGASLDFPEKGSRHPSDMIRISGWAFGGRRRAVAVEARLQDGTVRRLPVNRRRPDVASHFDQADGAEFCGFEGTAGGSDPKWIDVDILLEDATRVRLATIALRTSPEELAVHPGTAVLYYHRIADFPADPWSIAVTPAHFEEHLQVLRRYFHPIALRDFVDSIATRDLPPRSVAVTFDDGYADNLSIAMPLLERQDVPGMLFATSGALESEVEFWWDQLERILFQSIRLPADLSLLVDGEAMEWQIPEEDAVQQPSAPGGRKWRADERPENMRQRIYLSLWRSLKRTTDRERRRVIDALGQWADVDAQAARPTHRTLTSEELCRIARSGLIEIGAHTVTHPVLPGLDPESQVDEIGRCKRTLEEILGKTVSSFAYPFGEFDADSAGIVRGCGFHSAFTAEEEIGNRGMEPFRLPRFQARDWSGEEFERRLSAWFLI